MRHLSVVLAGIMLLSVAACEAQAKPERKEQKEKSKAPDKGKAAARVFKIYKPYHILRKHWAVRYGAKYVLVDGAFSSEFETRRICKGISDIIPGFLFTNFDPKLWYCIDGSKSSEEPLPNSVLQHHTPANPRLRKNDAFIRYTGVFQAADTGTLKISRKGLRFVTALNEKVLLAFAMTPRPGFRRKGKEKDYGRKWPLDPRRYNAQVWTINTAGATVRKASFETCGITTAYLCRFVDGNRILMLVEEYHLPKSATHFRSHFYVWRPDGMLIYTTVAKDVIPSDVPRDGKLRNNRFFLLHREDTETAWRQLEWKDNALVNVKTDEE